MKKIIKKIISTICVCAILVVPTANMVFAAQYSAGGNVSTVVNIKAYEKMTDAELIQKMKALGMTQDEINYLLKLEKARISKLNASTSSNSIGIMSFPSNPKIGDYHTEKYHVYFTSAAMTVTGVVAALVGAGVGLAVALAISAGVLDNWLQGQDAKGVDVTIKYYYGPDNQGSVGWTPGPVTWKLFY